MEFDRSIERASPLATAEASDWRPIARWGGILAGLVTVLALLALFGEIGMAAGMSAFDVGDRAAPYAVGAGIWGAVSAILAFLAGGYVGSLVSKHVNVRSGLLQGALVWALAVPVIGVLGASLTVSAVTATGVTTIAAVQADPEAAAQAREAARAKAAPVEKRPAVTEDKVQAATRKAGAVGWAAVGAMLLSLAAAAAGGRLAAACAARCPASAYPVGSPTASTNRV